VYYDYASFLGDEEYLILNALWQDPREKAKSETRDWLNNVVWNQLLWVTLIFTFVVLEFGLKPNSTQKLAHEVWITQAFINSTLAIFVVNVGSQHIVLTRTRKAVGLGWLH